MSLIQDFYHWIDLILAYGAAALRLWAIVDCAIRKKAAFPAVNKLTKLSWLTITVISGVLGTLVLTFNPLNPISLISIVIALVYLADVRPAVREAARGGR